MQADHNFPFPKQKSIFPLALEYSPEMKNVQEEIMNPFLGYPSCPLIGRYNKGQYRIAQTICHLRFNCQFDKTCGEYKCGTKSIHLPEKIVQNLRNIPQVIKHNKPQNQSKNSKIQDVHPERFQVLDKLKVIFVISFGEIGKDFLNYLNHMYTLGHQLFLEQKLRRSVYLLPIYAYLPFKSGLIQQEVDKGLNLQNYRSEYLSLHLKYGAPAFSPNNMRLGVQGMKKIVSNPPKKNKKGKNQKYKQQKNEQILNEKRSKQPKQKIENGQVQEEAKKTQNVFSQDELNWEQLQNQINAQKLPPKQQKKTQKPNQKSSQFVHKGYIHFYTSVLLPEEGQHDYRVYYHWHLGSEAQKLFYGERRQLVHTALLTANSFCQFITNCQNLLGYEDQCVNELSKLFNM